MIRESGSWVMPFDLAVSIGGILLVLLGCGSSDPRATDDADRIGYVQSVEGVWLVDGDTVRVGRALLRADTLFPARPPPAPQKLSVVLNSGRRIELLCQKEGGECSRPLIPADSLPEDGWSERTGRIVEAVWAVIEETPGRYESLISRGEPAPAPGDAVLRLDDGRVDLEPLLGDRPAGTYSARFRPPAAGSGKGGRVLEFVWNPERTSSAELPLDPGLYEIAFIGSPSDDLRGLAAWILLVTPDEHDETHAAFEEARRLTEAWGADADSDARVFLRACLEALARGRASAGRPVPE